MLVLDFGKLRFVRESAKLCTFNTPFVRYMFTQLPFCISSAQDVLQAIMSEMFEDIEGVEGIVDDLLIYGQRWKKSMTKGSRKYYREQGNII